ncbi:MAG: hypothetical protein LBV12_01485 [Puniceicoccales bacterium]|jgi:hypothetical protein|nr:hypothetical protein [Puniceicoccales bacterium]
MIIPFAAILIDIHKYFGETLQLVALIAVVWIAIKGKAPIKRVAPVLLDINFVIGIMVWILEQRQISVLHPVCMIAALALAHIAAKKEKPGVVIGLWCGVLALLVVGILIAKGKIAPGLWLV